MADAAHVEVLEGGLQALVQDYPGRQGMLRQGFFPSGAMDHFAIRAANLLVGNPPSAAGCTWSASVQRAGRRQPGCRQVRSRVLT